MTCPASRYTDDIHVGCDRRARTWRVGTPAEHLVAKQMACCSSSLENIVELEWKRPERSRVGTRYCWSRSTVFLCWSFAVNGADANVISTSLPGFLQHDDAPGDAGRVTTSAYTSAYERRLWPMLIWINDIQRGVSRLAISIYVSVQFRNVEESIAH